MTQKAVLFEKKKLETSNIPMIFLITCAFLILLQILHLFLGEISSRFYSGTSTKQNI